MAAQHLATVSAGLALEQALAGEADNADADALGAEQVVGADRELELGADAEEGDVGVGLLDEHVRALKDAGARRQARVLRQWLAGQADDAGGVARAHGGQPGARDLLGVAGAELEQVRHGAVEGRDLDGLVGGAVLADGDGVVCGDVDDLEVLQRGHADGGRGVEGEDEEGGGDGDEGAGVVGREAIGDGGHGVFARAVVDVAAGVGAGEGRGERKVGLRGEGG